MKISTTLWAVKLSGRSLYKKFYEGPTTFSTKQQAKTCADGFTRTTGVMAEAVRVKVRIEEIK